MSFWPSYLPYPVPLTVSPVFVSLPFLIPLRGLSELKKNKKTKTENETYNYCSLSDFSRHNILEHKVHG